jgi:hypothetical protein
VGVGPVLGPAPLAGERLLELLAISLDSQEVR